MLVDAAGSLLSASEEIPPTAPKPNSTITSGQVIINYVNHFIKEASKDRLNYVLLSHFHPDHMGNYVTSLPMAPSGNFRMGGITEVGAKIPFETIIDRGYPDYNYPADMTKSDLMSNYVKFIDWSKNVYGAKAEQFKAGRYDQIVLKKDPSKYPGFRVRNIVANGIVWSGSGTETTNTLPPAWEVVEANPDENIFSIGFELSYGPFNYFAGGDLQYSGKSTYSWKDIEAPVANVMTAVDAMKANHHGTSNCNSDKLLMKLAPQTVLIHPWRDVHPNPETIGRFFAVNSTCNIFNTNMTNPNKERLITYLAKFKSLQGHIVLRVEPGGAKYNVYVLDDSNEEYKVTKVFGPFTSN
jgi:ribonuclease BN (tRNA processing enzyme)